MPLNGCSDIRLPPSLLGTRLSRLTIWHELWLCWADILVAWGRLSLVQERLKASSELLASLIATRECAPAVRPSHRPDVVLR